MRKMSTSTANATNLYGWVGKILRVDLSTGQISEVPTTNYVPRLIGGAGVIAKIAWDEIPAGTKAFDAGNKLIFMTGPMGGTLVPSAGRTMIGFVSPLTIPTEDYVKTTIGGFWGTELKYAGYDGLIVQGQSSKPVYIWVNDGKAEIRDATKYWGMGAYATQKAMWNDLGSKDAQILAIAPSGENLVRFAVIEHHNDRATGVGGAGAVMGYKKLKAIAVVGTGSVKVAKPDELAAYVYTWRNWYYNASARPPQSPFNFDSHGNASDAPGPTGSMVLKANGCPACVIACHKSWVTPDGVQPLLMSKCTAASWYGSYDLAKHGTYTSVSARVPGLLDEWGISQNELAHTSAGSIITWLRGCYSKGYLKPADTGISFDDLGEYACMERLVKMIVSRQGFGDKLAEGLARCYNATGKVGSEFMTFANRGFGSSTTYSQISWPTAGLEAAMQSSREQWTYHYWARRIMYDHEQSVNAAGGGWLSANEWGNGLKDIFGRTDVINQVGDAYYEPNKAWLARWLGDFNRGILSTMLLCEREYPMWFSWYSNKPYRRGLSPQGEPTMFSLVTGIDMDVNGAVQTGERTMNLERCIMVRAGRRRTDDTLDDWNFRTPLTTMAPRADGVLVSDTRTLDRAKFETLKDAYYTERGWDVKTGIPTRAKLEQLGLKDVADDLEKTIGKLP